MAENDKYEEQSLSGASAAFDEEEEFAGESESGDEEDEENGGEDDDEYTTTVMQHPSVRAPSARLAARREVADNMIVLDDSEARARIARRLIVVVKRRNPGGRRIQKEEIPDSEEEEEEEEDEQGSEMSRLLLQCKIGSAITAPAQSAFAARYRRDGRWGLVKEVFHREYAYHAQLQVGEKMFYEYTLPLSLAVDDRILEAVLEGNVSLLRKNDPDVEEILQDNLEQSKGQICHYLFELVDERTRESPTPAQLLKLADHALQYLENSAEAWKLVECVDTWKATGGFKFDSKAMRRGVRRYCRTGPSTSHVRELVSGLYQVMRSEPKGVPLRRPLREGGYAINGKIRISQQKSHQDSANYLMCLFEAIAAGWMGMPWRMQASIVLLGWEREHGSFGEIFLSCVGETYTKYGRGFNYTPAGTQIRSADGQLNADKQAEWASYVAENTSFFENREREKKAVAEFRRKMLMLRDGPHMDVDDPGSNVLGGHAALGAPGSSSISTQDGDRDEAIAIMGRIDMWQALARNYNRFADLIDEIQARRDEGSSQ